MRLPRRPALVGAVALLPLLGCREICACPPGIAAFVLYGQGPAEGQPGAMRNLRVNSLLRPACTAPGGTPFLQDEFPVALDGSFRAVLLPPEGPGQYCARLTFFAGDLDASDSVSTAVLDLPIVTGPYPGDSLLVAVPPP